MKSEFNKSQVTAFKNQKLEKWLHLEAISIYFLGRYGMTAQEFYQARIKDKPHSWEEEDTYFDWVTAEDQIPGIKKEIRKLEEFLLRADDQ